MQQQQSTPSDQSARSSLTSAGASAKGTKTKVVVVNLADRFNSTTSKGKKKRRSQVEPTLSRQHMQSSASRTHQAQAAAASSQEAEGGVTTTQTSSSNASLDMTPQRSRSEAPTGNTIGNVLYEVHQKLMIRGRKLSPSKLQAKQQERQQKAEHLRAKIELSRKEWCDKVSQRQQLARERFKETVERKRLNLQDRLQQAARNKEAEIRKVVEKAEAENVKAEETNFIIKLTKQNNKLDLNMKFKENEERRKQQLKAEQARIKGQLIKREAAEKRREELSEEIRTKILSKEQKREQAEQRRKEQQIAEKNKAIAEKTKRDLVRARKHVKRHKISDIMNFVSNRESLWEFIGMEQDLDSMGLQFNLGDYEVNIDDVVPHASNMDEKELLKMIQQDQFELEKLMLKRDHEVLSECILEQPDGSIKIIKSAISLLRPRGGPKSSSSGYSSDSSEERKEGKHWQQTQTKHVRSATQNALTLNQHAVSNQTIMAEDQPATKFLSPGKQTSAQASSSNASSARGVITSDIRRLTYSKQNSQSFKSNLSSSNQDVSVKSRDDIMTMEDGEDEDRSKEQIQLVSDFNKQHIADEKFEQKIQQQRIRVAMRRNILKRNLSEDLLWAAEMQTNPNSDLMRFLGQQINQYHHYDWQRETRSQNSSLERNSFSSLDEEIGPIIPKTSQTPTKGAKIVKTSVAHLSKRNKNKGGKNHSSKSSLHSSGPINMQGISLGSKDLNPLMNSARGKRNSIHSIHDLQQQTSLAKQKRTLSNQGSCSSLSSLIKTKKDTEELFSDKKTVHQPQNTLNSAQLEQLGPVVKMPINGYPFTQNMPTSYLAPSSPSAHFSTQNSNTNYGAATATDHDEVLSSTAASIFSTSTATGHSFQLNSLILSQRQVPSKTNLSSAHMNSNLSKSANLHLFPIREQKIILMYKERDAEFYFAQAKINVKLEEITIEHPVSSSSLLSSNNNQSTPVHSSSTLSKKAQILLEQSQDAASASNIGITSSPITPQKSNGSHSKKDHLAEETKKSPTKSSHNARTSTPTSAKKNSSTQKNTSIGDLSGEPSSLALDEMILDDSIDSVNQQSDRMVNLIVKKLLIDQMQHIRIDDSQKSILFDKDKDSQAVVKYLEVNELKFKYCRLCEVAIYSEYSATSDTEAQKASTAIAEHFQSKMHVRKRDSFSIKEVEDLAYSLLVFSSLPGEIEVELRKENEKALKRKVKRLKQSMQTLAVSHENALTYPGKELKSPNKNRLQIRCIELQKSVFPDIKFETVEAILNDVTKVLEKRGAGDLHLMRKLKFVPTMVDMICKRISTCPRTKLGSLAKVINLVIKVLTKFCSLRENRNYMLQTNRLMPLIDLLSWCLNRQTELFFGIEFMPGLFQVITTHLKHRVPFECQLLKEHMIDLLICSSIPAKLKNKLAIVKSIQSNEDEDSLGQVPFFLLKSVAFLEALTAMISMDARTRPVYEKSYKIGEHVFFVLQSTELLGITQMITTLLLTCNETFKASAPSSASQLVLPQTVLSLTIMSMKVLNNMMRMDVGIVQHMMLGMNEQLYHLLSFILSYTEMNLDTSDDAKELLHETLIFIGYLCLLNEGNQRTLHRGENSILQKLCNLPFTYFMDKKLKEILFPTLVTVSYMNERGVAIMDQEMNMSEFLVKYIETNIQEELPKIMEQEQEYFSDHTKSMSSFGRTRSPSQHSTGSNSNQSVQMDFLTGNNPYLPLVMRFPKNLWKDAAQYYKSKADN